MNNKKIYKLALRDNIKRYRLAYIIVLSLIAVLELYMAIRLVISGKASTNPYTIYMACYMSLFVITLTTLVLLILSFYNDIIMNFVIGFVNVYCVFLILWSAVISLVDIYREHTAIVFLTIIVLVASVILVKPVIYISFTIPSALLILLQISCTNARFETQGLYYVIGSDGYLINFLIFVGFACLLTVFQYNLKMRAFKQNQKLEKLSYYDQLTDVYNRNSLFKNLSEIYAYNFCYFGLVDIDNFKKINDTYGHDAGDSFLVEIASLLKEAYGDNVYRYGGDEFVIVVKSSEEEVIYHFNEINKGLESKYPKQGIHVSAGLCLITNEDKELLDCFKKADSVLYEAKDSGKKKIVFYKKETIN